MQALFIEVVKLYIDWTIGKEEHPLKLQLTHKGLDVRWRKQVLL